MFWTLLGIAIKVFIFLLVLFFVAACIVEKATLPRRIRKEKARTVIRSVFKHYW